MSIPPTLEDITDFIIKTHLNEIERIYGYYPFLKKIGLKGEFDEWYQTIVTQAWSVFKIQLRKDINENRRMEIRGLA